MAERFGFQAGKLMMSQFRSRTRIGRKKRLLQEAEKILRSGAVEEPKWFTGLKTVVPTAPVSAMKPRQIVFPEDKLIRAYYNRHPTAKFLPIDLASDEPHFVRAFAQRQLKIMRSQRVPEDVALRVVQMEAMEEDRAATEAERRGEHYPRRITPRHKLQTNRIEQIQEEEELAWRATKAERAAELVARRERREAERAALAAERAKAAALEAGADGDGEAAGEGGEDGGEDGNRRRDAPK